MMTRYIEIGKICAVGFVQVEITFPERGVGAGYYGQEERWCVAGSGHRAEGVGAVDHVFEYAVEHAVL